MKTIAILGGKGGTTKTASSHLLCLGYLHGVPAAYALTDPLRKVRGKAALCRARRSAARTIGADLGR